MARVEIVLNREGIKSLLKSEEMMSVCKEYAEQIRQKCGDGYEVSPYVGKNRVNVSVSAETLEARKDNSENNTLLKAMGGSK